MKRQKIIKRSLLALLLLYLLSYIGISIGGHYEPIAYGFSVKTSKGSILRPKGFGYIWNPFPSTHLDPPNSFKTAAYFIYLPLISLDQAIWHTQKTNQEAGSGKYRVKLYFDHELMEYRNIAPQ